MTQNEKFYFIQTYGCQMNQSDSEHYAGQLEELGYRQTDELTMADVILLNTCCVRETAEDKTLGKIGELKHLKDQNPDLIIAVTGCMAQEWQDRLFKRAPHIDLVIGTHNIHTLIDLIKERQQKKNIIWHRICMYRHFMNCRPSDSRNFLPGFPL